jgi:hypothetical protein
MEEKIYQILKNHKLSPKKREEVLADLLLLLDEECKNKFSELSIFLEEVADKDRLKSLTSNQIRTLIQLRTSIEQFKKK